MSVVVEVSVVVKFLVAIRLSQELTSALTCTMYTWLGINSVTLALVPPNTVVTRELLFEKLSVDSIVTV